MAQAAAAVDDDDDDITVIGDDDEALGTPEERGDFLLDPDAGAEPPEPAPAAAVDEDHDEAVPKARFDQERVRRLMAEAELQRLQEAMTAQRAAPAAPEAPALSIEELDRAAWEAAMEGDEAKAAALRGQMLAQMEQRAVAAAEQAIERRAGEAELKRAVAEVREAYPQLDADPALTGEVVAYRDFLYLQQGVPLAAALRKAAKTVLGAPAVAGTGADLGSPPPDPAMQRRRAAVERAAQASRQQPAAAAAVGVGMRAAQAPTRNVDEMSEDEFAALSPAELKRLRGDAG